MEKIRHEHMRFLFLGQRRPFTRLAMLGEEKLKYGSASKAEDLRKVTCHR